MRKVTRGQAAGRKAVTGWWSVCGEAVRNTFISVTKLTNNKSEFMQPGSKADFILAGAKTDVFDLLFPMF
jgi:hypothetical protein